MALLVLDGIIGWARGNVDNCYNIAEINATGRDLNGASNVGGIAGGIDRDGSSINNCYNVGTISGAYNNVGGIIGTLGNQSTNTLNNGVNAGDAYKNNVLASIDIGTSLGKIVGYRSNVSEVTNSISITKDQLKNYTNEELKNKLGEEFVKDETNINNGYPILKWQLDSI